MPKEPRTARVYEWASALYLAFVTLTFLWLNGGGEGMLAHATYFLAESPLAMVLLGVIVILGVIRAMRIPKRMYRTFDFYAVIVAGVLLVLLLSGIVP